MTQRAQEIRRAQKESLLLREISKLYLDLCIDKPELQSLFVNRVQLSSDKSGCNVFFFSTQGEEKFKELFPTLILYKPSMRKAIAHSIPSRRAPDLVFKYDYPYEKQQQVELALNTLKYEDEK